MYVSPFCWILTVDISSKNETNQMKIFAGSRKALKDVRKGFAVIHVFVIRGLA